MDTIQLYKSCPAPTRSPWGPVQTSKELAPGIWQVTTAGHGGIKLSRERNAGVPKYMRAEGGWYEEDCQWSIVAVVHPIGFQRSCPTKDDPFRCEMDVAYSTLKNWYPEHYEQFFDCVLKEGESSTKDERLFKDRNQRNFVVTSASGDWANWVPEGMVGVHAVRAIDNCKKWFLVPAAEYETYRPFVIDLTKHQEIERNE